MKTKKKIWLCCVLLSTLLICGFSHNSEKVNPEEKVIYDVVDLDDVYSLTLSDKGAAFQKYHGHSVALIGTLSEKGKKNKDCILQSSSGKNHLSIDSSSVSEKLNGINDKSRIIVYGTLDLGSEKKVELSLKADDISSTALFKLDFDYCLLSEKGMKTYSKSDSTEKTVPGSSIRYSVPNTWLLVEAGYDAKAKENVLFADFGKYYMLNKLDKVKSTQCFCIFNIEYCTYLKYETDWKERAAIERAVISNVCQDEKLAWYNSLDHYTMWTQTYKPTYGKEFDHFMSSFGDHDVEFFFVPVCDEKGKEVSLCVMIYTYDDKHNYADDILYVLRTLEVGTQK